MSPSPKHELLVIDDNPGDVDLIRHTVRRMDLPVHVSIAPDAEGATHMLRERLELKVQLPDLVFADINLPGQKGLEMLAEWKADPGLRRTPVIVLSSTRSHLEVLESYQLGAAAFIRKPGNLRGYRDMLQRVSDFWFGAATLPNR